MSEVEKLVERLRNDFAPYWDREAKTCLTPEVARAYYERADQAREAASTLQSQARRVEELEGALRAIIDNATDGEEFTTLGDDFIIRGVVLRKARSALSARLAAQEPHTSAEPSAAQLAEIAEAARLLIVEGLRLTPGGLIVREKADRSDPHYRLCTALEGAGLIPMSRRCAKADGL